MQPGERSEVREPGWVWVLVWTGFPLVGAAAGAGLIRLAGWAADQRWVPFGGLFRLLDRYSGVPLTVAVIAAGALLGLGAAWAGAQDRLAVTVGRDRAELVRGGSTVQLERRAVTAVFADGKQLVAVDADARELAREKSDLEAAALREAFTAQGWPWRDADPYAAEFRLWVDDLPDLPPAANPLLRARAKVLSKKDEAAELRTELGRIGVVVRDDKRRQYVRVSR